MIKLIFLTFLFFSSSQVLNQAYAQDSEENIEEEFIDDEGEEQDEELPALEAPYADAEEIQLSKKKKKAVIKKSKVNFKNGRYHKKYISHPNAKKGLYKITADGKYLYKTDKSKQTGTISIRMSPFQAPNLINPDTNASFDALYTGTNVLIFIDYEWKLDNWIKNLSLKLGSGIMFASGNGVLESTGEASKESFTFLLFPNSAALSYRFDYSEKQWIVPYVEGGGGYFVFSELRDDREPALGRWGGAITAHAAGGIAFSLTRFSRDTAVRLDAEYGINNVMITAGIRQILGIGNFDFTSTLISGGLVVQY